MLGGLSRKSIDLYALCRISFPPSSPVGADAADASVPGDRGGDVSSGSICGGAWWPAIHVAFVIKA
jgi:hypothetical protein